MGVRFEMYVETMAPRSAEWICDVDTEEGAGRRLLGSLSKDWIDLRELVRDIPAACPRDASPEIADLWTDDPTGEWSGVRTFGGLVAEALAYYLCEFVSVSERGKIVGAIGDLHEVATTFARKVEAGEIAAWRLTVRFV